MNFKQIESFLCVADLQSFTKAARHLYMSQPAVSFQIKALEEYLSVVLFKRGDKKMILTDAGRLMYREAKQMFFHYKKMKTGLDDLKGLRTGELNIGAGTIPGEYILPFLIRNFLNEYPGVRINLRVSGSDQVVKWVQNHEVDLGYTGIFTDGHGLECSAWLQDELLLIVPASHNWAELDSVRSNDLLTESFILREKGSGTRQIVEERISRKAGMEQMPGGIEISSSRAVVAAVEAQLGVSVVSRHAARDSLALGRVKEVAVEGIDLSRTIHQLRHRQNIGGFVMDAFIRYINTPEVFAKYDLAK